MAYVDNMLSWRLYLLNRNHARIFNRRILPRMAYHLPCALRYRHYALPANEGVVKRRRGNVEGMTISSAAAEKKWRHSTESEC